MSDFGNTLADSLVFMVEYGSFGLGILLIVVLCLALLFRLWSYITENFFVIRARFVKRRTVEERQRDFLASRGGGSCG